MNLQIKMLNCRPQGYNSVIFKATTVNMTFFIPDLL